MFRNMFKACDAIFHLSDSLIDVCVQQSSKLNIII